MKQQYCVIINLNEDFKIIDGLVKFIRFLTFIE